MNFSAYKIDQLNDFYVSILAPNIFILGFYIFIGVLGNSVVIYIYRQKMRESTDSRFFIPALAIADIVACITSGLSVIFLYAHYVTFNNDIGCKLIWFSMTMTTSAAAMILVFIAYHRYTKICKLFTHGKLMEYKIHIVAFLYVLSLVISCPILVTSGITRHDQENVTFYSCDRIKSEFRTDDKYTIAIAYTIFEALVVVSIATLLTFFYGKVGVKLYHHFQSTNRSTMTKAPDLEEVKTRDSIASINSQLSIELQENRPSDTSKETASVKIRKRKDKFNKQHKYTYIFIAISVICVVTYSPRMTLMIFETLYEDFWVKVHSNTHLLAFLKFLNRFYIVNNIMNPFLYAMFDPNCQQKLLHIITCNKK